MSIYSVADPSFATAGRRKKIAFQENFMVFLLKKKS